MPDSGQILIQSGTEYGGNGPHGPGPSTSQATLDGRPTTMYQPPPAQVDSVQLTQAEVLEAWLGLLPYVLGIVVYLVFIFEFYRFVARRDVFELRLRRYARGRLGRGIAALENVLRVVLYLVEHVVVYPVLITAWYLVFVVLLAFLARGLGVETLLLVAMAVVAAVRVTAYYSEDLSRDLAKMLPLALLGVVILEGASSVAFGESLGLVREIGLHWRRVLAYVLLLVPLELVLRVARVVVTGRLSTVGPGTPTPDVEPGEEGQAGE